MATADCPPESWVQYDNFAQPLIRNWCLPCHSVHLDVTLRQGAPVGVDFDTYDEVVRWSDRILVRTVDSGDMPPVAGPTDQERASLAEWVSCGMPGGATTTVPVDPCAALTWIEGDAANDVCSLGNAVRGDLILTGDADLDCLCEVAGSVSTTGGALDAPRLRAVGGDFSATGSDLSSVTVPSLSSVGGGVSISAANGLASLDLSGLRTAGAVTLTDLGGLARIDLARLTTVSGDLAIAHAAALGDVANTDALLTVGGDLSFTDLPGLVALGTFAGLTEVGGDLSLREVGLSRWSGLASLTTVGGTVRVADNPSLVELAALPAVTTVGGAFEIEGNPVLEAIDGFPVLASVGRFTLADLPALGTLAGPPALVTVSGDVELLRNPGLFEISGFEAVTELGGTLRITDNSNLTRADGFAAAASIGALELARNPALAEVRLLPALALVGDVALVDLPALAALPPMPSLTEVGAFTVRNTGLPHLFGVEGLAVVRGALTLDANGTLASVEGLFGIDSVDGSLFVVDNPTLPTAEASALVAAIGQIGGTVEVSGNAP